MIKQCPYCGSRIGLFSKEYVSYQQYYRFDGKEDGYGEFTMTGTSLKRKTTPLYCIDCEKQITTLERLKQEVSPHDL